MRHILIIGIIILGIFYIFLCSGQEMEQDFKCLGCHENIINYEKRYIHLPFEQQKCSVCHIKSRKDMNQSASDEQKHGNGLRTRDDLGINVCYTCHKKEKLGISHPVGVKPKGKIKIPKVLPTGTWGQLLCISCHFPHGSDEEYRGRKPVSDKLCLACHGEQYK